MAVKYEKIDGALHDLGRSFLSATNYVAADYVMYEVEAAVRQPPHELWINFSTGEIRPDGSRSDRLMESVALYREGMAEHLRKHDVDPAVVQDVTLHHRLTRTGAQSVVTARDDRDVEHRAILKPAVFDGSRGVKRPPGAAESSRRPRASTRKRAEAETSLRRSGRNCPLCLEDLPRISGQGRQARRCSSCDAQFQPGKHCVKCRQEGIWEAASRAACQACGHHGSKVRVVAGSLDDPEGPPRS